MIIKNKNDYGMWCNPDCLNRQRKGTLVTIEFTLASRDIRREENF